MGWQLHASAMAHRAQEPLTRLGMFARSSSRLISSPKLDGQDKLFGRPDVMGPRPRSGSRLRSRQLIPSLLGPHWFSPSAARASSTSTLPRSSSAPFTSSFAYSTSCSSFASPSSSPSLKSRNPPLCSSLSLRPVSSPLPARPPPLLHSVRSFSHSPPVEKMPSFAATDSPAEARLSRPHDAYGTAQAPHASSETNRAAGAVTSPIQAELIQKNAEYAQTFSGSELPTVPARSYAVVTCMDSRIDNFSAFGVTLGDAHIIRNAGGNARDAFRSLVISQHMLNTREIILIKHTCCGMQMPTDLDPCQKIVASVCDLKGDEAGAQAAEQLKGVSWGSWPDIVEAVKDDVKWLRSQAAITGIVSGWVYDVKTGRVERVDV